MRGFPRCLKQKVCHVYAPQLPTDEVQPHLVLYMLHIQRSTTLSTCPYYKSCD